MNEAITVQAQPTTWSLARFCDLWTRLVTTCRQVGGRAGLRPADETLISRSTGGRC
jgi:hypothetical protein